MMMTREEDDSDGDYIHLPDNNNDDYPQSSSHYPYNYEALQQHQRPQVHELYNTKNANDGYSWSIAVAIFIVILFQFRHPLQKRSRRLLLRIQQIWTDLQEDEDDDVKDGDDVTHSPFPYNPNNNDNDGTEIGGHSFVWKTLQVFWHQFQFTVEDSIIIIFSKLQPFFQWLLPLKDYLEVTFHTNNNKSKHSLTTVTQTNTSANNQHHLNNNNNDNSRSSEKQLPRNNNPQPQRSSYLWGNGRNNKNSSFAGSFSSLPQLEEVPFENAQSTIGLDFPNKTSTSHNSSDHHNKSKPFHDEKKYCDDGTQKQQIYYHTKPKYNTEIQPAFTSDNDYPPGWLVYDPIHGLITKEEANRSPKPHHPIDQIE